jgi:hypothetical protein
MWRPADRVLPIGSPYRDAAISPAPERLGNLNRSISGVVSYDDLTRDAFLPPGLPMQTEESLSSFNRASHARGFRRGARSAAFQRSREFGLTNALGGLRPGPTLCVLRPKERSGSRVRKTFFYRILSRNQQTGGTPGSICRGDRAPDARLAAHWRHSRRGPDQARIVRASRRPRRVFPRHRRAVRRAASAGPSSRGPRQSSAVAFRAGPRQWGFSARRAQAHDASRSIVQTDAQ